MRMQWVFESGEGQSGCGDSWVLRDLDTGEPYDIRDAGICECGHHENDHEGSDDMKRAYCGGGLSESCSCRSWRPW